AWSRIRPSQRLARLPVGVELRHGLAAPLTMAIEPGHRLFAAHPVDDIVGKNIRHRAGITIGEYGDPDAPVGQHGHQRAPADPTAAMAHDALAAIAEHAEAEAVMHLAHLGEFGGPDMHARR